MQVEVERDDIAEWEHLLARVIPMRGRLITTKPEVRQIKSSREIIIPDTAKSISKEFGLECRVLKINPYDMAECQDITVGSVVIIPEFAGVPLVIGVEVPFWAVGLGDIMAVVTD
jgi:co-chaperonin GroES (HSP10)